MGLIRANVLFSGRVQGVGFRFTTYQVAQRHTIYGSVKNLADGRVQCVIEGSEPEIRAFLADLQGTVADHTLGKIDEMDFRMSNIETHEYAEFEIL